MQAFLPAAFSLFQVVFIDLVLAGDNAVVVGMAVAGLPVQQRGKAFVIGLGAATVLRIAMAGAASMLLGLVGLLLAGGILLLWVCWKMWRELEEQRQHAAVSAGGAPGAARPPAGKTIGQAVVQIVVADISMSLDNVLAVAGAAHDHPVVMAVGLCLSVLLMGVAASLIARLLDRHRWVAYIGLVIILGVAAGMIYRGSMDTFTQIRIATGAAQADIVGRG